MDARAAQRVQFRIMTLVEGQHAGTPMVPSQAVAACVFAAPSHEGGARDAFRHSSCWLEPTLDSRRSPIMAQQIGALHQHSIDLAECLDDDEASSELSPPSVNQH